MHGKELEKTPTTPPEAIVLDPQIEELKTKFGTDPVKTIVELGLGIAEGGKIGLFKALSSVALAARTGQQKDQFLNELLNYQEKGKIGTSEEIKKNPYASQSLVDILLIIDDNLEEDRFKAIKAMFFSMIRAQKESPNELLEYELFRICKKLSSSELRTLKIAHDLEKVLEKESRTDSNQNPGITSDMWRKRIAEQLGYDFIELVDRDVSDLVDKKLLPKTALGSSLFHPTVYKVSGLGAALLKAIDEYDSYFLEEA